MMYDNIINQEDDRISMNFLRGFRDTYPLIDGTIKETMRLSERAEQVIGEMEEFWTYRRNDKCMPKHTARNFEHLNEILNIYKDGTEFVNWCYNSFNDRGYDMTYSLLEKDISSKKHSMYRFIEFFTLMPLHFPIDSDEYIFSKMSMKRMVKKNRKNLKNEVLSRSNDLDEKIHRLYSESGDGDYFSNLYSWHPEKFMDRVNLIKDDDKMIKALKQIITTKEPYKRIDDWMKTDERVSKMLEYAGTWSVE